MSIDEFPPKAYDNFLVVTSFTRPSLPWPGLMVFETDTSSIRFWNGAAWIGIPPSGTLHDYAGGDVTPGYLLADGTLKNRDQYFDLFAVCGFQYSPTPGVDPGNNEFYLPNVKGKVTVGQDAGQTEFDLRGETGGAKTHTLTQAEMPVHNHPQTAHAHRTEIRGGVGAFSNNATDLYWVGGTAVASTFGTSRLSTSETPAIQNSGSGNAHNNLQPYIALPKLIKI